MSGWFGNKVRLFKNGAVIQSPPGPKGLPLLGSLLEARRDPLGFTQDLVRKHGDVVHFRIGFYTGFLLNHPDYFRHVLNVNHSNYNKKNYNYKKLKPVLGEGLITSDGEQWQRHRNLIQPLFHHKQLANVGGITIKAAGELLEQWDSFARQGQPVDVATDMMKVTLRVVAESMLGVDIRNFTNTVDKAFTTLNADIAYRFKNVFIPPLWVPTPRNRTFRKAQDELNRLVYQIIDHRRGDNKSQDNFLDMLLSNGEMTDREIRDEVMTLMLAGHETTANLLAWTCYLISQHSAVAKKLRTELDEVLAGRDLVPDDLPALSYTKRVVHESLRLYPPVWITSRRAVHNDSIGEYTIPSGSTVTLCSYTLHRHPDFWENPEGFNPEHFSSEQIKKRHKYAYLPFGGGPRACIGKHFAMMETQLVLAMILRRYSLKLVPGCKVEPEPLVTLRPRNGLKMLLEPVSK